MDCPEEFTEFAGAYTARPRRTAYLLCGNWHTAEDLTQIALTQTLLSWRKVHRLDPWAGAIAITPDGKTAYSANWWPGSATPMSTATNKPGKKIKVGNAPNDIVFAP